MQDWMDRINEVAKRAALSEEHRARRDSLTDLEAHPNDGLLRASSYMDTLSSSSSRPKSIDRSSIDTLYRPLSFSGRLSFADPLPDAGIPRERSGSSVGQETHGEDARPSLNPSLRRVRSEGEYMLR